MEDDILIVDNNESKTNEETVDVIEDVLDPIEEEVLDNNEAVNAKPKNYPFAEVIDVEKEVVLDSENDTLEPAIDSENINNQPSSENQEAESLPTSNEVVNNEKQPLNKTVTTSEPEKTLEEKSLEVLSDYGENFSTKEYVTNPAIGRDEEIKQLIVTLLTPEKSAILVGKPGIGKTAIVEGLGYRIRNNDVPNALKGYTIFKLNTASLTGTMPGTNELRIQYIVNNLKNLDKIMIFIDEIHTLIGNSDNSLDFANIFKPIIDRGTIKIIGATTVDEYNRYVLKDKAFVRRFQKIDVAEPTREMVIQIMMGTYPKFEKKMGLKLKYTDFIKENIMAFITDATSEYKRVYETSVRYPDIALTILQQAFSYAAFDNREEVTIRDVRKAILTTKLIYPDVIKKELVRFNEVFKDVYLMETKQILKDEA